MVMANGFNELSQNEMMEVDGGDWQDVFEGLKVFSTVAIGVCTVGAAMATAPATALACGALAVVGTVEYAVCDFMSYKAGKMGV